MSITRPESLSEQTTRASLRQWQAVLGADEWSRAWEAMAEPAAEEPERRREALTARCDACGREADLDTMVQGRACDLYCGACRDARTDGGWEPEEFFEEGG